MERMVSFIHEGLGQVFVYSGIERMMSLHKGKNYFTMVEARSSMNTQDVKKYTGGLTPTQVPLMEVEHSELVDENTIVATGTLEIDGVKYNVVIDKDSMSFDPIPDVVEAEPAVEEVVNQPTVEEVEPEPAFMSRPVEEAEPEPEAPVVAEEVEPVQEFMNSPVEEEVHEPEPEEVQETEPETVTVVPIVGEPDFMNGPVDADTPFTRIGMHFGNRSGVPLNLNVGTRPTVHGMEFHGIMSRPNSSEDYRNRRLRRAFGAEHNFNEEPTSIFSRSVESAPKPAFPVRPQVVEEPEPSADEILMQKWKDKHPVDTKAKPEEMKAEAPTAPVDMLEASVEETPVEAVADEAVPKQKKKEAVRAKLSKEVNEIIGDIPVDCLGPIMEFTSHEVDTHKLDEQGDMFCIDNRWHKQGNWYCIDVVPTASRYFYNAKRSVSMEIPINVCKEWLEAIK